MNIDCVRTAYWIVFAKKLKIGYRKNYSMKTDNVQKFNSIRSESQAMGCVMPTEAAVLRRRNRAKEPPFTLFRVVRKSMYPPMPTENVLSESAVSVGYGNHENYRVARSVRPGVRGNRWSVCRDSRGSRDYPDS